MTEPIDQRALEQLEEVQNDGAGEGFVANLINLFLADMEQRTQAMGEAVHKSDWEVAGRMAHAIKGSCGHFGAKRLAELCVQMEGLARGQECADAQGLFAQLQAECQRVRSALKAHRLARDK
jgi:HPt (histidine-containing phosphotransfer) domain-containing protein